MTAALLIAGIVAMLIGAAFLWLNTNSPVQTPFPIVLVPGGAAMVILALGGLLL